MANVVLTHFSFIAFPFIPRVLFQVSSSHVAADGYKFGNYARDIAGTDKGQTGDRARTVRGHCRDIARRVCGHSQVCAGSVHGHCRDSQGTVQGQCWDSDKTVQ